ncbi:hypothetical protein tb265_40290 [Gemmatimonadetes bacterium T265]|nr:hypothetical protein tb265_40290 [Gemmatimonadetes bacterium T265]
MSPDPQRPPPAETTYATADAPDGSALHVSVLSAALTVADLATSLAWYRDVLGLTVARTFERAGTMFATSLRAGAVPLLLTQDDGAKGADRVKGVGISLMLTTGQDVDVLAATVTRRGGVLESPPFDGPGGRAFRLRDPDGFRLVIAAG